VPERWNVWNVFKLTLCISSNTAKTGDYQVFAPRDITRLVVGYIPFVTTCQSHIQGLSRPRRQTLEYQTDRLSGNVGNKITPDTM